MPRFRVGSTFVRLGAERRFIERPGDLAVVNDNRTLRGQLEASVAMERSRFASPLELGRARTRRERED